MLVSNQTLKGRIIMCQNNNITKSRKGKHLEYSERQSIEQATLREVKEELGIEIKLTPKCYEIESQGKRQYFFVARYKSGEIGTGTGEEMTNINYEKHGAYIPKVIPKEDIKNIEIKDIVLRDIEIIFGK